MITLIPLIPVIAFAVIVLTGFKLKEKAAALSVAALGVSFLLSLAAAFYVFRGATLEVNYPWLPVAAFSLRVDLLSSWMLLLVSGVGLLIQIYSIGYMWGDPRFHRFFAYLSLFCAAMLGLVLANNFLLLYICWELVGLCSYFLIGFWFEKPSAAAAAKKAFIFTRAGDIGFFLGILIIFLSIGKFDFNAVFDAARSLPVGVVTVAALLLFCGAIGKSAQFPLHVWLPDAMEGPTPVSALIHAATMVAAGVYLVARLFPLFELAPLTLTFIGYLGIATALMAGLIAVTQNDIKKILAYSTISQLGFMMLAMGSRAPGAGIFHLLAHGFFKALLFLGAGSIIHAVHTNEIGEMGGLAKAMPVTFITFMAGTLALSGIPPFAGFFSKDEVLNAAYRHLPIGFALALPAVFLTAFYMFRLCFKVFPGETKGHPHESPWVMTAPLIILAFFTAGFGFFNPFKGVEEEAAPAIVLISSLAMAFAGILAAWLLYGLKIVSLESWKKNLVYQTIAAKFYLDEFFIYLVGVPVIFFSRMLAVFDQIVVDGLVNLAGKVTWLFSLLNGLFDVYVVDGLVNLSGLSMAFCGERLRRLQTGLIQNYLLFVLVGIVIILFVRR
ncbi:NADH-quinone oxidoreductase subunit L [Candidatus Saganbacteria bacterium]|uniref:NADH-quinone oxidoreductase subunit L n=1 Tax=Candidatus Saganbacteria bacterium TaxID=2575572 RepID=A0A9D6ULN3_UNCSA|nr:NADH-quinone oxidoreductase subunit L [Candidatus Saganbacteria bacterium]